MASVDNLRNNLINKILAIRSEDFLEALDNIISSSNQANDPISLNQSQKEMLLMGLNDVKNGNLISQDDIDKADLEWLNEK